MKRLKRPAFAVASAVAVVAAVVVVLLLALPGGGQSSSREDLVTAQSPEVSADSGLITDMDSVPGFNAVRDESILRDETIAVWEAWKRDVYVQECMSDRGFTWALEVLYPEEEVALVAEALGVTPSSESFTEEDGVRANDKYRESLSRDELDKY